MSVLKIIFDTNTFQPGSFDLLEQSPMVRLCAQRRISPIYSHIFLEETFRAYGAARRRTDLVTRWLPFIASTVDKFSDDFLGIWHKELVQAKGTKTNIFMSLKDQKNILAGFSSIPLDGSWRSWHATELERSIDLDRRANQKATSVDMRRDVANWVKEQRIDLRKYSLVSYSELANSELDFMGRALIHANIKAYDTLEIANRWARDKQSYPFFTTFVRNIIYLAYHAATRPDQRIDLNAQADLDLATHLLYADILVTNETGFLRTAFLDIWKPKGKVMFTTEQLCEFMKKL